MNLEECIFQKEIKNCIQIQGKIHGNAQSLRENDRSWVSEKVSLAQGLDRGVEGGEMCARWVF